LVVVSRIIVIVTGIELPSDKKLGIKIIPRATPRRHGGAILASFALGSRSTASKIWISSPRWHHESVLSPVALRVPLRHADAVPDHEPAGGLLGDRNCGNGASQDVNY
jgi:hypothetical protein